MTPNTNVGLFIKDPIFSQINNNIVITIHNSQHL